MKLKLPQIPVAVIEKLINEASGGEKQAIESLLMNMALAIHKGDFETASEIANDMGIYRVPVIGKFIEMCIYGEYEKPKNS